MSKVSVRRRKFQIKKKQKRRAKLAKLRELYDKTKTAKEKEEILEKAFKISPKISKEAFLAPLKK